VLESASAPYLGLVGVPLFTPLLSLIPHSLQSIVIPISIASMGIIASARSVEKTRPRKTPGIPACLSPSQLSPWFSSSSIQILAVAHVEVPAADQTVSFAVGFHAPQRPPCEDLSRDALRIAQKLGFDEAIVDGYFGDTQTRLTKLALVLSYIGFQ